MKYFYILGFIFILINCTNKENKNIKSIDNLIVVIDPLELINKLNYNEQKTIDDFKYSILQLSGIITSTAKPSGYIIRYDEFGNLINNIPKTSIVTFGYEENGWEIFFHFNEIVVDFLNTGDVITIQGTLDTVERNKALIAESLYVNNSKPLTENEKQYRDVIYIDINNCVIIDN